MKFTANYLPVLIVAALVVQLGGCQATNPDHQAITLKTGQVPVGELGHPLGELLFLEGTRANGNKFGDGTLHVDRINGQPAPASCSIWIANLDLPNDQRCLIRGYETIEMTGDAPAYAELARMTGKTPPRGPQASWQVHDFFVALQVLEPETLKLNSPQTGATK